MTAFLLGHRRSLNRALAPADTLLAAQHLFLDQDLDFSIGFYEGGNSGMPTVGIDPFEGRAAQHIIIHTMEMMLACMAVIWGGVRE